jgi:phosphoribosylanthranilate isomerase
MSNRTGILEETVYNISINYVSKSIISWLENQDIKELKSIIKTRKDIVPQINQQVSNNQIRMIPEQYKQMIVNYLPVVQNRAVNDVILRLKQYPKYKRIIDLDREFVQELLTRGSNILIVRVGDLF